MDKYYQGLLTLLEAEDRYACIKYVTDALSKGEINFVFQFHYLLPEFTALENVLMPYLIKNGRVSGEIIKKPKN